MTKLSEIRHICHIVHYPVDVVKKGNVRDASPAMYRIIVLEE
jgi:hypothetical protein